LQPAHVFEFVDDLGKLDVTWSMMIPRCRRLWTLTDEILAVRMAGETAAVLGR
jgi:hypothetical protein